MLLKKLKILVLLIICISCQGEINYQRLVSTTIKLNKIETPILVHRTSNNSFIKDSKSIKFLDTKELIENSDENFYTLFIKDENETIKIVLQSYKSGYDYLTIFDKKNNFKILKSEVLQTKRGESKPYYIYFAILKKKYPKYMNWKYFKIPEDSIK